MSKNSYGPGQRYGKLVSVKFSHIAKNNHIWEFDCDCGNKTYAHFSNVRTGATKSCGCINDEHKIIFGQHKLTHGMSKTPEYVAWYKAKFNCTNKRSPLWEFFGGTGICFSEDWLEFKIFLRDIGRRPSKNHILSRKDLNGGFTKDNCFWEDRGEFNKRKNTTHGMRGTNEWAIWQGIKNRCHNKNHHTYPTYGGRGIIVCERWLDFKNFFLDMGERPSKDHSVERRDLNGNYDPDNCYWATDLEQQQNKTNTIRTTFHGGTVSVKELAKYLDMSPYELLKLVKIGNDGDRLERIFEHKISKGAKLPWIKY